MNSGALKGYPEQLLSGEVLQANANGNIVPKSGGGITSVASFIKWGNE